MKEVRETYSRDDESYVENGIKYDHFVLIKFYTDDGKLINTISFDTDNAAGKIL